MSSPLNWLAGRIKGGDDEFAACWQGGAGDREQQWHRCRDCPDAGVRGATVIVHGRSSTSAEQVAQSIAGEDGKAVVVTGDLATDKGAERVASAALAVTGAVDILINNAGTYANHSWMESTAEGWAARYNTNVLSAVRLVQHLIPQMKARGWGRLIQMASGEATQPFAFMPDYAATKAALVNLTVSLAKEVARTGITVNTVSPGIIVTDGMERFYREVAASRGWGTDCTQIEQGVLREVLDNQVGRLGRVEEVSNLVAFIASPLAGFINGTNLRVDGGSIGTIN
jgi:NAD(P)-dependent dehydrogenase (short-subunit alcohol dehydrogenase family)